MCIRVLGTNLHSQTSLAASQKYHAQETWSSSHQTDLTSSSSTPVMLESSIPEIPGCLTEVSCSRYQTWSPFQARSSHFYCQPLWYVMAEICTHNLWHQKPMLNRLHSYKSLVKRKPVLIPYVNYQAVDRPAHSRHLISVFVVCFLDNRTPTVMSYILM